MIFDLWDTLAAWPVAEWQAVTERTRLVLGLDRDGFDALWQRSAPVRAVGPLREALVELGIEGEALEELLRDRSAVTRRALVPVPGAVEAIRALRERELRVGLISVCTDEVAELWQDTPFRDLFDDVVLSCTVGLVKPDPRVYRLACERLGVEPEEAMFVGDGANDELAGAAAVGMTAVLAVPPGRDEPAWESARDWEPRVHDLREVVDMIGERSVR